jgi:hypothetical protein
MRILRSGAFWTFLLALAMLVFNAYVEVVLKYQVGGLLSFGFVVSYLIGHVYGMQRGERHEKDRALALCHQCLEQIWSGSVRRVLNGIQEDRTKLLSEDEFFGPEPGVSSVQSPNDPQERPPSNT